MTAIRLTTEETAHSDVLAGPETFDPPTITVVDAYAMGLPARCTRTDPAATPRNVTPLTVATAESSTANATSGVASSPSTVAESDVC